MASVRKLEIVDYIYENLDEKSKMSKKDIDTCLTLFFDAVKKSYSQKKEVELRGFGSFRLKLRKNLESAKNPKTNEKIGPVPQRYKASFVPGKEMSEIIQNIKIDE